MPKVVPFPTPPRFWIMRAYRHGGAPGRVVAVFFRMAVDRPQDECGGGDQDQGDDAAQQAVGDLP